MLTKVNSDDLRRHLVVVFEVKFRILLFGRGSRKAGQHDLNHAVPPFSLRSSVPELRSPVLDLRTESSQELKSRRGAPKIARTIFALRTCINELTEFTAEDEPTTTVPPKHKSSTASRKFKASEAELRPLVANLLPPIFPFYTENIEGGKKHRFKYKERLTPADSASAVSKQQ